MHEQSVREFAEQSGLVTADRWFEGGRRLAYDPVRHRILDASDGGEPAVSVFERTALPPGTPVTDDATWLTILPGFPDGSYGWAQVDRLPGDRQIDAARRRVPAADIQLFPGGHLTISEHPDLLAVAITTIAGQHGVRP